MKLFTVIFALTLFSCSPSSPESFICMTAIGPINGTDGEGVRIVSKSADTLTLRDSQAIIKVPVSSCVFIKRIGYSGGE